MIKMKEIIEPTKNVFAFFGIHILIGLVIALLSVNHPFENPLYLLAGTLWGTVIVSTQWIGHAIIQTLLERKYSWIEHPKQRIFWTVLLIVGYSITAFILVQIAMGLIFFGEIPQFVREFNVFVWGVPVLISFTISMVMSAIGFFRSWKASLEEQEALKTEMLTYKYESLRNQINPHFMFNSLNVLSDLVYDDQGLAVKFIHQFSDIYRYVLDSREKELVPLEEELAFIEKFLFLLKIRLEDKLRVHIDLHAKDDERIVPLALQLLIENVVKHNEASSAKPLDLFIARDGDYIRVSNPIQLKKTVEDSSKIGLKNLEQQYAFFSDQSMDVREENGQFVVQIPILKEDLK